MVCNETAGGSDSFLVASGSRKQSCHNSWTLHRQLPVRGCWEKLCSSCFWSPFSLWGLAWLARLRALSLVCLLNPLQTTCNVFVSSHNRLFLPASLSQLWPPLHSGSEEDSVVRLWLIIEKPTQVMLYLFCYCAFINSSGKFTGHENIWAHCRQTKTHSFKFYFGRKCSLLIIIYHSIPFGTLSTHWF